MKLFMMPQTVPNRPTNGAVAPMVASTPVPLFMSRPAATSRRARRVATRSLMPLLSARSADRRSSSMAASISAGRMPRRRSEACARIGERALLADRGRAPCAAGAWPPTARAILASHTVHVTSEANDQADHDPLHEDVGRHEHRPGRQIARQVGAAERQAAASGRGCRAAGAEGGAGWSVAARRGAVGGALERWPRSRAPGRPAAVPCPGRARYAGSANASKPPEQACPQSRRAVRRCAARAYA